MRKWMILAAAIGLAAPVAADEAEDTLLRLMTEGPEAVSFTDAFLDQVSVGTLNRVLERFGAQIGPVMSVSLSGGAGEIVTDTHRMPVEFALDGQGRVAGLFFSPPQAIAADLAGAQARLSALGGEVAWLATRDGAVISERGADEALAVASAFKLGVLTALVAQVDSGARHWADVVRIEARHRSLPTGAMQNFPEGSPVTLHTAALAMIAQSDNTAADLLIDVVGRDAVADALGLAPEALLTTREMFGLKLDGALADVWRAATDAGKPAIAAEAAAGLDLSARRLPPVQAGLEWYLPLTRLCALIGPLADLPLMQVNPGVVAPGDARWSGVAYKGGSEGGVVNVTVHARDALGRAHCVALTVNGTPEEADPAAVLPAFTALLDAVAAQR